MKTLLALMVLASTIVHWEDALCYLSGASTLEELSREEMERYENLRDHPLPLNSVSRSRLLSSGLLSPYQIEALWDYRARHGDILSFAELSLIDGIPKELSDALKFFVTLESRDPIGKTRKLKRFSGSVTARASTKLSEGSAPQWNLGVKSEFNLAERFTLCVGNKSFSATYYGKRHIGKIVAGDFNAKFGQGLVLWNGFNLSGFNSSEAFCRNGNGISACCSFSSGHSRGLAANLLFGKWSTDIICTKDGSFGGNLLWTGKSCAIGATFSADISGKLAAGSDFKFTLGRFTVFGEAAASLPEVRSYSALTPSGVLGINLNLGYRHKLSVLTKYDRKWVNAIGYQYDWFFVSGECDISFNELTVKSFASASRSFDMGGFLLKPSLRWQEKLLATPSSRTLRSELRGDVALQWPRWKASARCDLVRCSDWAFLSYVEGGYAGERFQIWLRPCFFLVNNWSDRIYCYERDAPGSFNVSALNGRGLRISMYAAFKSGNAVVAKSLRTRHNLYLRLCYTSYPSGTKASSGDVRLQYNLSF